MQRGGAGVPWMHYREEVALILVTQRHSAPLLVTGRAAHPAGSVLQWMLDSLGLEEQIGRPWPV